MGIWDFITSTTEAVKRNAPAGPRAVKAACETTYGYCSAAAGKIDSAVRVNGVQRLYGYVSNEENRSQIGLFASRFAQSAAHYAVRESYKLIPGGVLVSEIVREVLKDQPNSRPYNGIKKQDLMVATEEMQAKMEKLQEDVNILKQQNQTCTEYSKELEPLKDFPDEHTESSVSTKTNRKKDFIRSRL